jgi:hypothetical protein
MLITSEMMQAGQHPVLFTGGACNIQTNDGPMRNEGRDPLAAWLDSQGWTYFDPQIHPSTHGREYEWAIDAPQEKIAREQAKIRVYEITSATIAAVTMFEIMDDARNNRSSIVWFNNGRDFSPPGLGNRDTLRQNSALREQIGDMAFSHLDAYLNAGRILRKELPVLLGGSPHIKIVDTFTDLINAIKRMM